MNICFLGYRNAWPVKKWQALSQLYVCIVIGCAWNWSLFAVPFRLLGHIDVIVAQTVYHGLIALFLRPRTPLIVENHGDLPYRNKKIARFVLQRAKACRAVSCFTANQFPLFGYRIGHIPSIHIFPAWTDIDLFLDAYIKYKKPHEKIILYAGEIAHHKGVHVLLDAFKCVLRKHPDAKLHLIGNYKDAEYMKVLRRKAFVIGSVSFSPHMPQDRLAKFMTQADVVAVPSLREGFGRVALEAMACGTPVVASNVGGLPEIVEHTKTGYLVPPTDMYLYLAFWINDLLKYPDVGKFLGIGGQKKARELFSTEMYVEGYRKLIGEVMEQWISE